jgi:1-deoxy-D-xylulose-5-phosphate reductoisomerase
LGLAFEALEQGGNAPCILNAANEIAVARFLNDEIKFLQIAETVEKTLQQASFIAKPSLEELITSDAEARGIAASILL